MVGSLRGTRFQSTLPHGERRTLGKIRVPDLGRFNPRSRTGSELGAPAAASRQDVQSTLPHGERLACPPHCRHWREVSIHAPARGATARSPSTAAASAFQSTLPHGERPGGPRRPPASRRFNPRSRTGSDVPLIWEYDPGDPGSNPRSRTGSDGLPARRCHPPRGSNPRSRTGSDELAEHDRRLELIVSIHAPARGATCSGQGCNCVPRFQSTLPHGERPLAAPPRRVLCANFNPRSRTGSDSLAVPVAADASGFNPRSRTGSDNGGSWIGSFQLCFNPRSRTGSDQFPSICSSAIIPFQSTLPHGERRASAPDFRSPNPVSIHAPARGATEAIAFGLPPEPCFNPRSRTGSDAAAAATSRRHSAVSIHAPARGATPADCPSRTARRSFNPRSRTGSDPTAPAAVMPYSRFQSTLPHGERPQELVEILQSVDVSIHAPARGATLKRRIAKVDVAVSIHAPARGATATRPRSPPCRAGFNPRSRTGSDLIGDAAAGHATGFNPRSRTGSDSSIPTIPTPWSVSIHAPARGATRSSTAKSGPRCFNPRSRTGSDGHELGLPPGGQGVSIHAPARGATPIDATIAYPARFQSTLPHGERREQGPLLHVGNAVSIHAPARGATRSSPTGR